MRRLQNVIMKNNVTDHLRDLGFRGTILSQWIIL